jgi:predicted component of type VI protein secretion system
MSKRLLVRDERGERERLLVGTVTVGRDTRCDISDADPLMSRRHAEFVCRPDSLVVRDLNSRNGVTVNGVKVQEAILRPGDVIKIARLVMTYLGDIETGRAAPPRPLADTPGTPAEPADGPRFDAARTEKIEFAASGAPGGSVADSQDDRTRVVPRQTAARTAPPGQLAVAQLVPPVPDPPPSVPASGSGVAGSSGDDSDSTRPVFPGSEARTAPAIPSAPSSAEPIEDWSLEIRPPQPAPPAAASAASVSVRAAVGSVALALIAFALGAVPLLLWRGRIVEPHDRLVILPTTLTAVTIVGVFGPALLLALIASVVLAWWLRRG